ncbi:thiaminase (transcriptional activator TenA) [Poseidonocella pacifica]|uniref:Aminopyrimidine aminohydrolase n=1 Tax=Poseidonocella pacifica TaxID=871651 RepID=A0A1I0YDZ4_9RHOB|nr:thiaminase II [Poseidonocella pacifica]SFB11402.1 thiaminase (transcriptional activator TenA) [Poseidonocella pacifica]
MTYGTTFSALRKAAGPIWQDYTHHSFVERLGDGTLPQAAFLHYLVQDYLFLIHFSRAWSLAVAKAGTLDEMRYCAGVVHALLHEEMQLHVALCGEAGINARQLEQAEERPENLAYTRYVLDAGYSGDFLDLLTALAPCVLGYGEIGNRLSHCGETTPYADWIATYGGAGYQHLCTEVGALLDTAVAQRIGADLAASPRWAALSKRFTTATRLEVGFWDMGLDP